MHRPKNNKDFFIGWADIPSRHRRNMLLAGLGIIGSGTALSYGLAGAQTTLGTGKWDQGTIKTFKGVVFADPYPLLRSFDIDGTIRTALLGCMGKCGVRAKLNGLAGQAVTLKGSLITNGDNFMIAVSEGQDWISPADDLPDEKRLILERFQRHSIASDITLKGEILDTKCWFGAMKPGYGKTHKACASLCIRSGLPPAFFVKDQTGTIRAPLLLDADLNPHSEQLLPLVADPVRAKGELGFLGDLLYYGADFTSFKRL